jgi:Protein of unknown function (DUF3800)
MSRYRLYFDESGIPSYNKLQTVHEQHLALCGVIFESEQYLQFQVKWEELKRRFFKGDLDEPIILHRKEIMSKSGIFSPLADSATCAAFNAEFLNVVEQASFTSLIVVINKASHQNQYAFPFPPYHYCLVALLQRYGFWLGNRKGDVMGESRGKTEDDKLKSAYSTLYSSGDGWSQRADFYQSHFTSMEIKLRPKDKDVAGLQLADLLAHPAKLRCLLNHGVQGVIESTFGKPVSDVFWKKIRRRFDGISRGWGEIYIQ